MRGKAHRSLPGRDPLMRAAHRRQDGLRIMSIRAKIGNHLPEMLRNPTILQ